MTLLAISVQTLRPTGKQDTRIALCFVGDGKRGAAHMKFWQRRLLFDGSSPDMWDCMKHWVIIVVLQREMCASNRLTVVCSSSWSYTFPSALYVKSTSLCPCLSSVYCEILQDVTARMPRLLSFVIKVKLSPVSLPDDIISRSQTVTRCKHFTNHAVFIRKIIASGVNHIPFNDVIDNIHPLSETADPFQGHWHWGTPWISRWFIIVLIYWDKRSQSHLRTI